MYRLEELFPDELQERLNERPILILPFGTIEWHSYHLPLGLDGIAAQSICEEITKQSNSVLAPVSYWAVDGVPYPYTLRLSNEVVEPVYRSIFEQFGAMGFKVIVAFTGHFGLEQTLTLKRAALTVMQRSPVTILPVTDYDLVTDIYTGDHAAVGETSLLWAMRPDLVNLGSIPEGEALDGVLGDEPRGAASAEKGRVLLETIAERTAYVALRLLENTSPMQRIDYMSALHVAVRILEKLQQQRRVLPKKEVAAVTTPAYQAYCQAIFSGDYRAAKIYAEKKLASLSE